MRWRSLMPTGSRASGRESVPTETGPRCRAMGRRKPIPGKNNLATFKICQAARPSCDRFVTSGAAGHSESQYRSDRKRYPRQCGCGVHDAVEWEPLSWKTGSVAGRRSSERIQGIRTGGYGMTDATMTQVEVGAGALHRALDWRGRSGSRPVCRPGAFLDRRDCRNHWKAGFPGLDHHR